MTSILQGMSWYYKLNTYSKIVMTSPHAVKWGNLALQTTVLIIIKDIFPSECSFQVLANIMKCDRVTK